MFEAIVQSNGWDNDTAALQLFSHLEGDALNVAHLVPLARRLSRSGLVDALTAHYGSPGRLSDYRRQFERTTRTVGEDPAIFVTALEALAVKARLRLIRDRFIASHSNCDLRRHLDSVSPETPIRDVVDRCRVWESHADPAVRQIGKPNPDPTYPTYAVGYADSDNKVIKVAAVTGQRSGQNQLEDLCSGPKKGGKAVETTPGYSLIVLFNNRGAASPTRPQSVGGNCSQRAHLSHVVDIHINYSLNSFT